MKVKPEFFDKWMENLTSGRFKKGKRALCQEVKGERYYCCLGVAEETLVEMGGIEPARSHHGSEILAYDTYTSMPSDGHASLMVELVEDKDLLPHRSVNIADSFSIEMPRPHLYPYHKKESIVKVSLPYLNDEADLTFSQIADLIKWEQRKHV